MLRSEFNQEGKMEFSEVQSKPRNTTRLQAGMFMERPDLWRSRTRKRSIHISPAQKELF